MAQFCTKCGAPSPSESMKFCPQCGQAYGVQASAPKAPEQSAEAPAQASPPPAPPQAPAAKAGSGGLAKILIAVVGVIMFIGVLGVGTCVYVGYKAKQKFDRAKAEYGLDQTGPAAQARDVCSLLTKDEAAQFTGVTVTETSGDTTQCDYYAAGRQLVLENDVSWQGGKLALKLGVASLKTISGGVNPVVQLQDIGDEAYTIGLTGKAGEDLKKEAQTDQSGGAKVVMHVLSESPLMFRKGDIMVTVRLAQAVDPGPAKQSIAKAIAERL